MIIKTWWHLFKNWIITHLGGYTEEDYTVVDYSHQMVSQQLNIAENAITWWEDQYNKLIAQQQTVEVMLDANDYGPADQSFDGLKQRAANDIKEALIEQIYSKTQHFITPDNKYIVSVEIINHENK